MNTSLVAIANDGLRIYLQQEEDGGSVFAWGELPGVDGIFQLEWFSVERHCDEKADRVEYRVV